MRINLTGSAQVVDGPRVPLSQSLDVQAFDQIDVELAAGATDQPVEVAPGVSPDKVKLLIVRADRYDPVDPITYATTAGAGNAFTLDAHLLLLGTGGVGLLEPQIESLFFTNPGANPVGLHIFVGRDA